MKNRNQEEELNTFNLTDRQRTRFLDTIADIQEGWEKVSDMLEEKDKDASALMLSAVVFMTSSNFMNSLTDFIEDATEKEKERKNG